MKIIFITKGIYPDLWEIVQSLIETTKTDCDERYERNEINKKAK